MGVEMDVDVRESRRGKSVDQDESPLKERWEGTHDDIEDEVKKSRDSSKHRSSKDRSKNSNRREEKDDRSKSKDRERSKISDRRKDEDKSRDKYKDEDRDKDRKDRGKEKEKERGREKEREKHRDRENDRGKERDRGSRKNRDEGYDRNKDDKTRVDNEDTRENDDSDEKKSSKVQQKDEITPSVTDLQERILKMKEERLQKKSEGASEVLSWVNKSRKIQEKKVTEKQKALQLSRVFEEQDNINQEESDDELPKQRTVNHNLGGVKILHGIDKVLEGGAVVLTLKDQNILADGDVNEEIDMLENVEIGEQKRREEAYRAAKKTSGTYDDKFNDDPDAVKRMLPQYDEHVDEGITLDAKGRFSGEAEKKLEELRKRIQGVPTSNRYEDLNSYGKKVTDYYTQEEMLQFKKPKKKKSLRKKEKLDLDFLEAEALASGLGNEDLGSRKDGKRQAIKEEKARSEAEMKLNAYKSAHARAEEAIKALKSENISSFDEDDSSVIGDDDEDLRKSLERARKLALKKQDESSYSGLQALARLKKKDDSLTEDKKAVTEELQESKVVFTEMEEFVWGLQLNEEGQKADSEDVFMEEEDEGEEEKKEEKKGGWEEIKEMEIEEMVKQENEDEIIVPDKTIHEASVGKGLAGALKLLKDRGSLKETVEWGGRNMDKKKSKLVGINDQDGKKEIHIERTDEYGRILTPKEAFRLISHKFHGKGPGKMKQEKRMRQYQEELKIKQMNNADTPSQSVGRMREVQAQLKTPYLVLSGNVKPGQTSDPRSGYATVEKDFAGGLTPMLGDKKVEHFLGLKRKSSESEDGSVFKKPKSGGYA